MEKHKLPSISLTVQDRGILPECTGNFSQKSLSRHFWRPSWIFAWNVKTLISETVWDRAILTKFLANRVYEDSAGDFKQKSLSRHF